MKLKQSPDGKWYVIKDGKRREASPNEVEIWISAKVERCESNQNEYELNELKQTIDRIFSFENIRLQMASFFGLASLTAVAAGFQFKNVSLILVAATVIFIFWILDIRARRQHLIYYYRGIELERKLSKNNELSFLEYHPSAQAIEARRILELPSSEERIDAIRKTKVQLRGIFFCLPVAVVIAELLAALFVSFGFGWPLFG